MYIIQRCVDFQNIQQNIVIKGTWRDLLHLASESLPATRSNGASSQPVAKRNVYAQLFETAEAVPLQEYMIIM